MKDGIIKTAAFSWDSRTAKEREDGYSEASINWEDDSGSTTQLFGSRQGEHGAARVETSSLEWLATLPGIRERLRWERKKDSEGKNPYHGNLLLTPLGKPNEKEIAGALAAASAFVPRQNLPKTTPS